MRIVVMVLWHSQATHPELVQGEKAFSSGVVEDLNNKAKVTTRNSYGFRTYRGAEVALYNAFGNLPTPSLTAERG
ncbi:MAG: transposase [Gammaproteobacteria bacterium]|nr:transposase [Gammaproteobacteria bacterium]